MKKVPYLTLIRDHWQSVSRYGFTVMSMDLIVLSEVPDACTLPTAARPLRLAEFDRLLAAVASSAERVTPERLRITLRRDPEVAAEAANLMVRETGCCSFFTFALTASADWLQLDVTVAAGHEGVLDALGRRASA